jgi:hypothetical protein
MRSALRLLVAVVLLAAAAPAAAAAKVDYGPISHKGLKQLGAALRPRVRVGLADGEPGLLGARG